MAVNVQVNTTPNEHALKFTLDKPAIESGHKTYASAEAAEESSVAKTLFGIDGVASVFLMADFVTVTKQPDAKWDTLQSDVLKVIQASYE